MILAIVVDTEGNEGIAYELSRAEPRQMPARNAVGLEVVAELGAFPFSGAMLSAMLPGVTAR